MQDSHDREALEWQVGVWDRISRTYVREIDPRFAPVIDSLVARAELTPGQCVLDLGTGTGAVAERIAAQLGPTGHVLGVDVSYEMLLAAHGRFVARGVGNAMLCKARAEALPAAAGAFDTVLASLSLMYVIDRASAAREIARILRPQGRFLAAVWGAPECCDIVRFQQTAGRYAPQPPAAGVGPGSLADPSPFLQQLAEAGIQAEVETETHGFDFDDFETAWQVLAGVTAAQLAPEQEREARTAIMETMYPGGDGPRHFRNVTHFITGTVTVGGAPD